MIKGGFREILSIYWRSGEIVEFNSGAEAQEPISAPEWIKLKKSIDNYYLQKYNKELRPMEDMGEIKNQLKDMLQLMKDINL